MLTGNGLAADLFLAEVGGRVDVKRWQIQQAADAVRIHRYQYRGASEETSTRASGPRETNMLSPELCGRRLSVPGACDALQGSFGESGERLCLDHVPILP